MKATFRKQKHWQPSWKRRSNGLSYSKELIMGGHSPSMISRRWDEPTSSPPRNNKITLTNWYKWLRSLEITLKTSRLLPNRIQLGQDSPRPPVPLNDASQKIHIEKEPCNCKTSFLSIWSQCSTRAECTRKTLLKELLSSVGLSEPNLKLWDE